MTGPIRGPHPDELISASLTDDLTDIERRQLDTHLTDCATCRATLEAFREQRRLVGKLRQAEPPRDLSARVRAGIETGRHAQLPWWQRTSTLLGFGASLATVAAAIMAVVIIGNLRPGPEVVRLSPSPVASTALPPASVLPSAAASAEPSPNSTPDPIVVAAPDYVISADGSRDSLETLVHDGETGLELTTFAPIEGPPIAAALSPNGNSLAYIVDNGLKGTVRVLVSSVTDGQTYDLGESAIGGPFVERLAWSTEGRYLAYALADPAGQAGTNVFIFDTLTPETPFALTDSGNAYVGSWDVDEGGEMLWISEAGTVPMSLAVRAYDPADGTIQLLPDPIPALRTAEGIFQPLINRDRDVIFWRGEMQAGLTGTPTEWLFLQDGTPLVADGSAREPVAFDDARPLFSDLPADGQAFQSAAIAWGPDDNTIAVWDANWPDAPGLDDGTAYPDRARVYFGHLDDPRLLTRFHALDAQDVPDDARVVDVALAATGRHLALTVAYNLQGDLDPPRADLLLVTRNTGSVADEVQQLPGATLGAWHGPGVYFPMTGGAAP